MYTQTLQKEKALLVILQADIFILEDNRYFLFGPCKTQMVPSRPE